MAEDPSETDRIPSIDSPITIHIGNIQLDIKPGSNKGLLMDILKVLIQVC